MRYIDPTTAHTAEDFVMLLRQVRALSELTYWQIEERAADAGHALEPSVLVEALGGERLPDAELVTGLLLSCGYDGEQVGEWLGVLDSLALQPADGTAERPHEPRRNPPRPAQHGLNGKRRAPVPAARRLLAGLGLTLILVAAVAVIVASLAGGDDPILADPPSFHQGAPTEGTATLPYPTAAPPSLEPTAAPTTLSPSPAQTYATTGVRRSGTVTLQNGQGVSLDTGGSGTDVIAAGDGDGIRGGTSARPFAVLANPSKSSCGALGAGRWEKSVHGLTPGATLCVRTGDGSLGRITVNAIGPLTIGYVLWT